MPSLPILRPVVANPRQWDAISNKSPFFKDGITRFWNSAPGFIQIRQQLSFSALPFSGPDGVEF